MEHKQYMNPKKHYWSKPMRVMAIFMALNLLLNTWLPTAVYALTSGASQPEVQSFEPIGTTDMVDLFTGDFTYNIPLFELPGPDGGYPFNLAYHSGIGMDQEASWVGLGWSLNPGAMTRQMRGLPDDFKGDTVRREVNLKRNITAGVGIGGSLEFFGIDPETVNSATPDTTSITTLSLGISAYYNNYKGFGYGTDVSLKLSAGNLNAGAGLGMDSQQGASVDGSLSLTREGKKNHQTFGLGTGYNSMSGLQSLSLSYQRTAKGKLKLKEKVDKEGNTTYSVKAKRGATLGTFGVNLINYDYPQSVALGLPMRSSRWDLSLKLGFGIFGAFAGTDLSGFYSREKIEGSDKGFANIDSRAMGYLHLEDLESGDLRDMSREKDGTITANSPNLAIPSYSKDMFTVTGQGIIGSITASRSDIGIINDQELRSVSNRYAIGGDIGGLHYGLSLSFGHGVTKSKAWNSRNNAKDKYFFVGKSEENPLYEPYYFHGSGESVVEPIDAMSKIGGAEPVAIHVNKLVSVNVPKIGIDFSFDIARAEAALKGRSGRIYSGDEISNVRTERKKRGNVVLPIENRLLSDEGAPSILNISYADTLDTLIAVDRTSGNRLNHIGAFYCTNPSGMRYLYGLPAYNKKQVECQFATSPQDVCSPTVRVPTGLRDDKKFEVSGTDHYYNRQEFPEFTYAHMLTSVLGGDYIDADDVPGPSKDDLGYWTKFSYMKTSDNFKWRAPFYGANYNPGMLNRKADDKGSYTYGEKEVYYLKKAETKSHIAIFKTSPRADGRGAGDELQNEGDELGDYQYKLDTIKLYTRMAYEQLGEDAVPLKEIIFEYDSSLCPGIHNTTVSNGGKLTLKKLVFRYGGSKKGDMTPYQFSYSQNVNPSYHTHKTDRWGNYKRFDTSKEDSICRALQFPYVKQDNPDALHSDVAAWSLSEIDLPSGATIKVNYESDDYAFVQDQRAMQMFELTGVGERNSGYVATDKFPGNTRVLFKLKKPIKVGDEWQLDQYFEGVENVKFNIKSLIAPPFSSNISDDDYENVAGYATVKSWNLSPAENGFYSEGVLELEREADYHPFAVATWQHVRQKQPDMMGTIDAEASSGKQILGVLRGIVNFLPDAIGRLRDYYSFARTQNWGKNIKVDQSWIRLNVPDGIKYGGGLRVKQLSIHDNWKDNDNRGMGVYGQVYDYTTTEIVNGRTRIISSGVASNEPYIGGEENALRKLKKRYSRKLILQRDYVHLAESPVNETFYPGPSVGYSKVTVKSIASAKRAGDDVDSDLPSDIPFGTTGASVNEFYTTKDFPVITGETNIDRATFNLRVPLGPFGSISLQSLMATQGYSIELNNMNGKPKKISNYPQNKDGSISDKATSYVEYVYKTMESNGKLAPDNKVPTLSYLENGQIGTKETGLVGHQHDFIVDMRENRTVDIKAGGDGNIEVHPYFPIVIVSGNFIPNVQFSYSETKTAVTNKIIFRSGVLEKTVAYDGLSKVETQNLLWDANTGEVLLSSVNNDYNEPVYSYNIPAYTQYNRMGHAYKNIGMTFSMELEPVEPDVTIADKIGASYIYKPKVAKDAWAAHLVQGDEFIIGDGKGTATYLGYKDGVHAFHTQMNRGELTNGLHEFFLYRSGRRNLLSAKAGSITSLEDPTITGTEKTHKFNVTVPK